MRASSPLLRVPFLVLLGGLASLWACDQSGLSPVGDTGGTDTSAPDDGLVLLGILVAPERPVIPLGGDLQLRATGLREDRTSVDVTALATWSSDAPSVAQVSDRLDQEGVLTGLAVGQASVYAEVNGVRSVPVTVKVTASEVLALTVTPPQVTIEAGRTARLAAEATYSDGTRADASSQVLWATGDGSVATVETGGKVNAVATGSTVVSATWGDLTTRDIAVTVVEGSGIDLRVSSVRAEGGIDDITLTVKITNDGSAGASDFWVDVFVDPPGPPQPGDWGDHFEPVFYLDAGQTKEVGFHFPAEPGEHTVWVVVDPDGAVEETDDSNNTATANVTVGESGGTNLSIPYFDYYADGTHILYVVDIYNSGTEPVGPFWVDLWFHSEDDPTVGMGTIGGPLCVGDEFQEVDVLAPGSIANIDFFVAVEDLPAEVDGCAYCWSWVMADTCNDVEEIYEDDNTAGPIEVEVSAR